MVAQRNIIDCFHALIDACNTILESRSTTKIRQSLDRTNCMRQEHHVSYDCFRERSPFSTMNWKCLDPSASEWSCGDFTSTTAEMQLLHTTQDSYPRTRMKMHFSPSCSFLLDSAKPKPSSAQQWQAACHESWQESHDPASWSSALHIDLALNSVGLRECESAVAPVSYAELPVSRRRQDFAIEQQQQYLHSSK